MTDDSDLFNRIQDRNVEQVNHVAKTLRRGIVGGKSDGTMAPMPLDKSVELVTLLQQIENNDANLRAKNEHLQDQLITERKAREHLENIIRQVADLIVNGSKGA